MNGLCLTVNKFKKAKETRATRFMNAFTLWLAVLIASLVINARSSFAESSSGDTKTSTSIGALKTKDTAREMVAVDSAKTKNFQVSASKAGDVKKKRSRVVLTSVVDEPEMVEYYELNHNHREKQLLKDKTIASREKRTRWREKHSATRDILIGAAILSGAILLVAGINAPLAEIGLPIIGR